MNPYVLSVKPREGYQLEVLFESGERRLFDARPYLEKGCFGRLNNLALFRGAKVVSGSVEWPGELDLSYDTIYVESRPITDSEEASS